MASATGKFSDSELDALHYSGQGSSTCIHVITTCAGSTRARPGRWPFKSFPVTAVLNYLMVLWADFFAPAHFGAFPTLPQLFWDAVHQAGEVKKSTDAAVCEQLLAYIDEIADVFWQTDKGKDMGVYPPA